MKTVMSSLLISLFISCVAWSKSLEQKKEELKRLKQIAGIKMKNKISAVEKIDSMILNQPNPNI